MHILLIEDDLDLGRALQSALKVEGLTSEWLRRAVDAPATLDATTIDCVLLDLTLPDGSGFALLARWRNQRGHALSLEIWSPVEASFTVSRFFSALVPPITNAM